MRCVAGVIVVALCSVVLPVRTRAQVAWPKESDGYSIVKTNDVFHAAPPGYEGKIISTTMVATGNTPVTKGKTYTVTVNLSTKIPTCPQADGTEDGDGEFSAVMDFKDQQPSGTNTSRRDMHSTAKYKGKVGDDALLINPITANVDYTFSQTGSSREQNGALTSPSAANAVQHITVPVTVNGADIPGVGTFTGGDFLAGHFSNALDAGTALAFMGGMYYAVAQNKWVIPDTCLHVLFDPPSNTQQVALGGNAKVTAQIKTNGGEGVRGTFGPPYPLPGGSVAITSSATDPGSPAIYYYTAPSTKTDSAGFALFAATRAGVAVGVWKTRLGTGWSGQISVSRVTSGDQGNTQLATWNNYEAIQIVIDLQNGVGHATTFAEQHHLAQNRRQSATGTISSDGGSTADGKAGGRYDATVEVTEDKFSGNYSVNVSYMGKVDGSLHSTSCTRDNCTSQNSPYGVEAILPGISGKIDDPNHLHGSQSYEKKNLRGEGMGTQTFVFTYDLSRQGSTP